MLVKFSTRHGQLVMLGEPAVALLRLGGHSGTVPGALLRLGGHSGTVPGAVLAADLPGFLERLRQGLELHGDELSPAPPPPELTER